MNKCKTREERRRAHEIRRNICSGILFFSVIVVACGLPNWLTWAGI